MGGFVLRNISVTVAIMVIKTISGSVKLCPGYFSIPISIKPVNK